MAKALYVLPIAAFAAIAFANCSKTESENTQDFTYDQELFAQLPEGRSVKFIGFNLDGTECMLVKEADGKVRRLSADEMGVKGISIPLENREIPENEVFMMVEDMPEFPGGEEELLKFVTENVQYPEDAKAQKQEGKVFIKFVIDKEGNVRDAEIVNGTRFESLNNEALRVIKSMPQWKPGKQSGQNVNVSYVVPIKFQLK